MSASASRLLLALIVAAPALVAEKWHRVTTPNFDVLTSSGLGPAKAAAQHFEQVRTFFLQTSKLAPRTGHPVRVIGFSSSGQFKPYQIREGSTAHYISGFDSDVIVMSRLDTEMFQTAIHEYVHALIRHTNSNYPLWLNEGTAEFFSTMKPVAGKVRIGEHPYGYVFTARTARLLPLRELFAVDSSSPHYNETARAGVFYSQSWALVHMLMLSETYRGGYSQFLKAVLSAVAPSDAIRQVYGKELDQVESDLNGYLRQDYSYVAHLDVKLAKGAEHPNVREAGEAEAQTMLAGLLGHKPETAMAEYRRIAAAHPRVPEPWEAMGFLALRQANGSDATGHFARAAELGSTNERMYLAWASALRGEGNSTGAVSQALRKAIALNPESFEARFRLGEHLLRQGLFGESLVELRQIKRVEPERASRLFLDMAYCLSALNMRSDAFAAAASAKQYAQTPSDLSAVERLFSVLNRSETMTAQLPPSIPPQEEPNAEARPMVRWGLVERAEGTIKELTCMGAAAKLRVATAKGELELLIADPGAVALRGAGTPTKELTCGPQADTPVVVGYTPEAAAAHGTSGRVRWIEFR